MKELTLNLAFTFTVITTIALFAVAARVFYEVPELGFLTYLDVVGYSLVQALSYLLPLSLLIAVVFVYGRAAADHEITTLKASGIHPYRVILPGLLLAMLLAALCVEVENRFAPRAVFEVRRIPAQQATLKALIQKRIANGESMVEFGDRRQRRSIQWDRNRVEFTDTGLVLHSVVLEIADTPPATTAAPTSEEEPLLVRADRAEVSFDERLRRVVLRLVKYEVLSGRALGATSDAIMLTYSFDDDGKRDRLKWQAGNELFALAERGKETVRVGDVEQPLLRRFHVDEVLGRIHERLSRAATPVVFLLLGVPLALIFKSGNRMVAFLLASLIAMFVYYPTAQLAKVLMSQRLAGPVLATWSGNALLAAIGISLLVFVVRR